jgi:hypothetical protein
MSVIIPPFPQSPCHQPGGMLFGGAAIADYRNYGLAIHASRQLRANIVYAPCSESKVLTYTNIKVKVAGKSKSAFGS